MHLEGFVNKTRWIAVVVLTIAVTSVAPAQATDSARVSRPLISRKQFVVAGAATASTLVLMRFDRRIQAQFRGRRLQSDEDLHDAAKQLSFLGGPGPFWLGAGFVAVGSATEASGLMGVGTRVTESVLLAASIDALGKGFSGRAVPTATARHQFSFGRGFHDHNGPFISFPSGHTAAAFALASAISLEAERSHYRWRRWIRPLSYSLATGVALSRVYQNAHWASDLPLGAVIGMWSGSTVETRLSRHNAVNSGDASLSLLPAARGLRVTAALRF